MFAPTLLKSLRQSSGPAEPNEPGQHYSAEAELLICGARTVLSDAMRTRMAALASQTTDWPRVLALAKYHGMEPLLYRSLLLAGVEQIPPDTMASLRLRVQELALVNRALAKELAELCRAFEEARVPVIPFRGAVLAAVAYQDPTLRDVDDIGFIVPRRRLADAQRALWAQAYRPRERWPQDGTEEGRDCLYVKKNSVLKVELQWVMAREHFQFLLDRPEVWERLSAVSFQGRTLQVLPPEELLAILCVHGSKRAWEKLKWAVDVAELVRASRLDWRRVFARAAQWKCRRMVLLGLGLAHHLLNASVPPTILSEFCADRDCPELAMRMPKSLLLRPDEGIGADAAPALYCSLKDSRRDRWRYEFVLLWHDHPILRRLPDWLRSRKSLARFASIAQAVRASWLFCRCMEIKTAVAGSKPSPR